MKWWRRPRRYVVQVEQTGPNAYAGRMCSRGQWRRRRMRRRLRAEMQSRWERIGW